jgi:hypothetical protein
MNQNQNLTTEEKDRIVDLINSPDQLDQKIGIGLGLEKGLTYEGVSEILVDNILSKAKIISFGTSEKIDEVKQVVRNVLMEKSVETFKNIMENEKH